MSLYKGVSKRIKAAKHGRGKTFNWGKVLRWYSTQNGVSTIPPYGYMAMWSAHKEVDPDADVATESTLMFPKIDIDITPGTSYWYQPVLPSKTDDTTNEGTMQAICLNSLVPYDALVNDSAGVGKPIHGNVVYGTDQMASFYGNYRVTSASLFCKPFMLVQASDYIPMFRFGVLILDTNDTTLMNLSRDNLIKMIKQRRDMGKLKTVPLRGGRDQRYSTLRVDINMINWCKDRVYDITATTGPADPAAAIDTNNLDNYTGRLSTEQETMAGSSYLPKIKVWAVPFYWLERPDRNNATAAYAQLINEFELVQHVQFTNPTDRFFTDAPYTPSA